MARVVFVTGGAGGIGQQACRAFATQGYRVAVADMNFKEAQKVAAQINEEGGEATGVKLNVAERLSVQDAVDEVIGRWDSLDVLINIAGYGVNLRVPFLETTEEIWNRNMDINAKGTFYCIQAVVPKMIERGYGRIINTSSGTYLKGVPNRAAYIASKAAVLGLTRGLARELGSYRITVNAIAPGLTESPIMLETTSSEYFNKTINSRSIPDSLHPKDLVEAFLFLASEGASMITGQTVVVNGGDAFI